MDQYYITIRHFIPKIKHFQFPQKRLTSKKQNRKPNIVPQFPKFKCNTEATANLLTNCYILKQCITFSHQISINLPSFLNVLHCTVVYTSVHQQIYRITRYCLKKYCNLECNSLTFMNIILCYKKSFLGFVFTEQCLEVFKKKSGNLLPPFWFPWNKVFKVTFCSLKSVTERNDRTPKLPLHEHLPEFQVWEFKAISVLTIFLELHFFQELLMG